MSGSVGEKPSMNYTACFSGRTIRTTSVRHDRSKRFFDIVFSVVILLVMSPIVALAMVLVKVVSRGPVIYSQVRLGYKGRPFTLYKIRTMRVDSELLTGARWASRHDPRVVPFGRILRLSHIDELPQLVNVFKGEMSLVGPRPERPEIAAQLQRVIASYDDRLLIRPGLTGLAQVQLPPDEDLDSVRRKLACDLHYLRSHTLWLDLRLLISTALGICGAPFALSSILLGIPSISQPDVVTRQLESMAARSDSHSIAEPACHDRSDSDSILSALEMT